jgi:site-specific DNA-adenine methylase
MSRFYFSYLGNKRTELKHIDNVVDWDDFDTIVEPFAGSAALTLEIHSRGLGKTHAVNDVDPNLIGMFRFIKEHTSQPLYDYCRTRLTPEEFTRHHKLKPGPDLTVFEYFYRQRVRGAFQRVHKVPEKWPTLDRGHKQISTDACFTTASITNTDWRTCVDAHKDNPRALIFLDPPYFNSFNQSYYGMDGVKVAPDGTILDGTALFLEMLEYLKTAAATIVVITNSCAIIDYIFAPYIRLRYGKKYSSGVTLHNGDYVNKSTNHILLVGGGIKPVAAITNAELTELIGF